MLRRCSKKMERIHVSSANRCSVCRECRERNKVAQQITLIYLPSARKLEWSAESLVEKQPEFKVVLRIEGIAQDVITSVILKRRETRRDSLAKRPLKSNGCPKRNMETL